MDMTKDEMVERARAAIGELPEGQRTAQANKVRNELIESSKAARAEALKAAIQIVVEHEALSATELEALDAKFRELARQADRYEERAKAYHAIKLNAKAPDLKVQI